MFTIIPETGKCIQLDKTFFFVAVSTPFLYAKS